MEEDKGKRSVTDMQPPKVTHSISRMQPVKATRSLNEMRSASESRQTRASRVAAQKKMRYSKAAHFAKDTKPAREPRPQSERADQGIRMAGEISSSTRAEERSAQRAREAEEYAAQKARAAEERETEKARIAGEREAERARIAEEKREAKEKKKVHKEEKRAAKREAARLRAEAAQKIIEEQAQAAAEQEALAEKPSKESRSRNQKPRKLADIPAAVPEQDSAPLKANVPLPDDAPANEDAPVPDGGPAADDVPPEEEKGLKSFGKVKYWIISVVVIAAAVGLVFFVMPRTMPPVEDIPVPSSTPAPTMEPDPAVEDMTPYTLAGILGEDASVFAARGEIADDGIVIGATALRDTSRGRSALDGFYTASESTAVDGLSGSFAYIAGGSENQQIQDVYNMINAGAKVIVVADATDYNFGRISQIAADNDVQLVAYNAPDGVECAVNVKNSSDPAGWFSESLSDMGFEATYTLSASDEQKAAVEQNLRINASYDDMWDAIYQIGLSVDEEEPMRSMMVFDYNSNDVMRAWLRRDTVPRAVAGRATTAFIKTWYQLLNGGVDVDLPLPADADEDAEAEVITVEANEDEFSGFAATDVANVGDVLFVFAANLARGGVLPEANFVYEIAGYGTITNDNIGEYYELVKDAGQGPVFDAAVDTAYINTLFAFPPGVSPAVIQQPAGTGDVIVDTPAEGAEDTPSHTGGDAQPTGEATPAPEETTEALPPDETSATQESEPPAA